VNAALRNWDAALAAFESASETTRPEAERALATAEREHGVELAEYDRAKDLEAAIRGLPVSPAEPEARSQFGAGRRARGRSDGFTGQALDVNERAATVPDASREKMAVALENDSDPSGRLARYVIAVGDPEYASCFRKWLRDPLSGHMEWTPQERTAYAHAQAEARAMNLGTTTAGGFLVSYELDPQVLISGVGSINPMRDIARVELTTHNVLKVVTSAGVTASWDAEASEVSDDSPVLAQPSIECHAGRAFAPVSFELFEDSPDLAEQLQGLFVDAKDQLEAAAFTTGSGTGQAKGVITAVAAVAGSVVTSAGSAIALADVVANQNALPPRWRPRAQFMANLSIINAARQLPAGSGLTSSLVDDSGTPPKMLGWNVNENSLMDGTIAAGTTDDFVLLSGDFGQYVIADRVGTTIEFVPHLFGANGRPTGQRGFLLWFRTGGDVVIPDAFRLTNYSA
jgi:HK97 family phage major capsid protein